MTMESAIHGRPGQIKAINVARIGYTLDRLGQQMGDIDKLSRRQQFS